MSSAAPSHPHPSRFVLIVAVGIAVISGALTALQTRVNSQLSLELGDGILAAVIPINFLAEMTSIGTLVAFLVVSVGVIILRVREPELERGFRLPLGWTIPILSIIGCIAIITQLRLVTILVFLAWAAVFLVFYWFYGRKRSALAVGHPVVVIASRNVDAPWRTSSPSCPPSCCSWAISA